jgi:hypothetical protein
MISLGATLGSYAGIGGPAALGASISSRTGSIDFAGADTRDLRFASTLLPAFVGLLLVYGGIQKMTARHRFYDVRFDEKRTCL